VGPSASATDWASGPDRYGPGSRARGVSAETLCELFHKPLPRKREPILICRGQGNRMRYGLPGTSFAGLASGSPVYRPLLIPLRLSPRALRKHLLSGFCKPSLEL